jgi:hypothetical protein
MMKKVCLLLIGLSTLFFVGCKSPSNPQVPAGEQNTTAAPTPAAAPTAAAETPEVQLNKGAKWEANPETTKGIAVMQGLLGEFTPEPTVEDFRILHKKLATQFQSILQKCTMTGEAHNQLHNYLLPLKGQIDKLGSESLPDCLKVMPELKAYLMKYSHYFV